MTTDHTSTIPAVNILVVDDTLESLKLLTEILTRAGYRVRPADGPHVALESALAHPPGLILLDVKMPEMSGFEMCRRLKQDARTSDIPVIFVSALQDVEDRVQGFEVGGVDFVSKPFQELEVLARVKTHLQLRTMQLYLEALVAERTTELRETNKALTEEIQERKNAQLALGESEKKYRTVVEEAVEGILVIQDGRRKYYNPVWLEMTGYSAEEYDPMPFPSLVHSDDLATVEKGYQNLTMDQDFEATLDFRIMTKSGDIRWLSIRGTRINWESEPAVMIFINNITEQKRAEQALRESETRFRATFEQAAVGIAHVALDGSFLRLNRKFCDIVGYSNEEMLARTFQDITHSDDLNRDLEYVRQLLAGEVESYSMEKRYFCKNGEVVWVNLTVSLLRKRTGEPDYFVAVVEDITKRKQVEEALLESEEWFRNLMEQTPVSIQIHSPEGPLVQSNAAYARLYALNEETLAELYDKYNVLQDEQAKKLSVMPFIEKTFAGEEVVFPAYEYDGVDTLKTLDFNKPISRKCWVQTRGFPLKDENGRVTSVVFMSEDITERKRAEAQLRFQAHLLEAVEQAVIVTDLEGHVLYWNPFAEQLYGWSAEEAMGRTTIELIASEQAQQYGAVIMARLQAGESWSGEYLARRRDGTSLFINTTLTPIYDEHHEPENIIGISADITERKQTEQNIQQYQQRLKDLASQLTLTEERERRRIAADLHDEVGQTLAFARIQLAAAREEMAESEAAAMLDDASSTIRQAIQGTRDLVFDLSSPLLNELGLAAALAEWLEEQVAKKHSLQIEFKEAGEEIVLDEDVRAILFRNTRELLNNVARHAQANKVSVRLARVGDEALVIVEDDGNGFDPLAVAETIGREGGFGLFSIRERMLDLGGTLEIVSEPGHGCTAILTAPLGNG